MKELKEKPGIIQGGYFKDKRGTIRFFNDFDLFPVRRFYVIEHPDVSVVRAWQAHKIEQKWFCVIEGSFKIVLVAPDNWEQPSKNLSFEVFTLTSESNEILHIPGGFANGFQALEPNYKLMVFSDISVLETANDDFRFEKNLWYHWE